MKNVYSQKEWFFKTMIFMFVLLAATGIFNFTIDSAGIFSHNELEEVAGALINGKMIAGLVNYDERHLQKLIIENSRDKFDIISLGSSRSMQLRHSFLRFEDARQKFFNHSMSGSSLEDYMAIIGLYESKGYLPKKVVIGVDPWIFNKNSTQIRWKSIGKYYKNVFGKIYGTKVEVDLSDNSKYLQLINLDYTTGNLTSLTTRNRKDKFFITDTIDIDDTIIEPDGAKHYPFKSRFPRDIDTQNSAKMAANAPVYSLEMFYKLSNTQLFEDFIAYLQKNGIEVMLLLPPYHPITYNLLVKDPKYKIIMDVEMYLKNLASSRNLKISGSYDPINDKFSSVDFFDGAHGKDIVMKKLCEKFRSDHEQS